MSVEPGNRVGIRDVAHAAGVHPSTVSRALKEPGRVSESVREHVLQVAQTLGYRPNLAARALTSQVSTIVPLLVPQVTNPFFAELASVAEAEMRSNGLHLMLCSTGNSQELEENFLEEMLALQAPLCILTPSDNTRFARLRELGRSMVVVLVDRVPDGLDPPLPSVMVDQAEGVGLALDHLYGLGHRAIAHLAGPQHALTARLRLGAYLTWMTDRGLAPNVIDAEFEFDDGRQAAMDWLGQRPHATAVLAANDLCAVGFMAGLSAVGIHVPSEVSIVGFDGLELGSYTAPGLTTVAQPIEAIAREAAAIGLSLSRRDGDEQPAQRVLHAKLVVRGSTTVPRRDVP